MVYNNPENDLQYWIDSPGSFPDYYGKKLSGDEIYAGIGEKVLVFS